VDKPIFEKGKKFDKNFIGTAYGNYLVNTNDGFDCQVYDVVFEKGARNFWHIHKGNGQILLCTDGVGYYQERGKKAQRLTRGDVVKIPPNIEHWHGASPKSNFTHIGISPNISKGEYLWLEPVSDEEYQKATQNP
jgi:quercetin dioxygenase-like cupin family protein